MKTISRRARNKKITLYNLVSSAAGVSTFQRTVINRVYLDTGYAQRLSSRGVATQDKAQLIIDLRDMATTSNRAFMPYKDWAALTDKAGHFTFNAGGDFFVEEEVTDELPAMTKQQMQVKYPCFSVASVADPADNLLQIIGR